MKLVTFVLPFGRSRLVRSGNLPGIFIRASRGAAIGLICLLSAFRVWSADCVSPPAGLVAWWPGQGNANDIAGTNNGTLQGGAAFATGMVGQAFDFSPASGTVIVPDAPSLRLTSQLTIEAWIRVRTFTDYYSIVSKVGGSGGNNGYQLVVGPSGILGALFNSPGQAWPQFTLGSASLMVPGVWYHVAWTYDQSAMKLYLNGAPVATNVIGAHAIATSTSNLRISGDDNNHVYFDGQIDEPSVYNRALSASEIAVIYNAGSAGKCLVLVPAITSQPQNTTVLLGSPTNFAVTALGLKQAS